MSRRAKNDRPARILVVDDDASILEYVETLLTRDGMDVTSISDPHAVEPTVASGSFDVVVLDLMMPGMSGLEALERLRRRDPKVDVVIFTGYPSLDSAVQSMKLGAVDYVRKPFQPEELREVLARILRKRGLVRLPDEQLQLLIGERIRSMRRERGMSISDLSDRTGLSASLLSQIERAQSNASVGSLYRVASALGVRLQDLLADI